MVPLSTLALVWLVGELVSKRQFFSSAFPQVRSYNAPFKSPWEPTGVASLGRFAPDLATVNPIQHERRFFFQRTLPRQRDPVVPLPDAFHTSHGSIGLDANLWNVVSPTFELDWVAEPHVLTAGGSTIDDSGNIYLSPLNLHEDESANTKGTSLISLDGATGERRWILHGNCSSLSAPLILDAAEGGQHVFHHVSPGRVIAVDTEGRELWHGTAWNSDDPYNGRFDFQRDVAMEENRQNEYTWGLSFLNPMNAIIGMTMEGVVFVLDRHNGDMVASPRQLSCAKFQDALRDRHQHQALFQAHHAQRATQEQDRQNFFKRQTLLHHQGGGGSGGGGMMGPGAAPPAQTAIPGNKQLDMVFGTHADGVSRWQELQDIVHGEPCRSCVHHMFAVDSISGTAYVLSSFQEPSLVVGQPHAGNDRGASRDKAITTIYQIVLAEDDADSIFKFRIRVSKSLQLEDVHLHSNMGLVVNQDGTAGYFPTTQQTVVAIELATLTTKWSANLRDDIVGGVAVASEDADEVYVMGRSTVYKVVDGEVQWRANVGEVFIGGDGIETIVCNDQTSPTVATNGVLVQVSAMRTLWHMKVVVKTAVVLLDRETGRVRYATSSREEAVGPIAVGPFGDLYTANLPRHRVQARQQFGNLLLPLVGGVSKYKAVRLDLLLRDGCCAMNKLLERALGLFEGWRAHPDAWSSGYVDAVHVRVLLRQMLAVLERLDVDDQQAQEVDDAMAGVLKRELGSMRADLSEWEENDRELVLGDWFQRYGTRLLKNWRAPAKNMCDLWKV